MDSENYSYSNFDKEMIRKEWLLLSNVVHIVYSLLTLPSPQKNQAKQISSSAWLGLIEHTNCVTYKKICEALIFFVAIR